jgi:hypothetical protein
MLVRYTGPIHLGFKDWGPWCSDKLLQQVTAHGPFTGEPILVKAGTLAQEAPPMFRN